MRSTGTEQPSSSDEGPVMGLERRGCVVQLRPRRPTEAIRQREELDEAKPSGGSVIAIMPCLIVAPYIRAGLLLVLW